MTTVKAAPRRRRPSFLEAVIWPRFFIALTILGIPFCSLLFIPSLKRSIEKYQLAAAGLKRGKPFKNSLGMSFVYIDKGKFRMGRAPEEKEYILEDEPREVTLTKGYWLAVTEVTQEQYESVMGENPSPKKGANLPVQNVTWEEAETFCRVLCKREGKFYRLPSEAEWEHACKEEGSTAVYGPLDEIAWYDGNSHEPHEVGQKRANKKGLHDMLGNVAEWCWDIDYNGKKSQKDPFGITAQSYRKKFPSSQIVREIRGGHYGSTKRYCRASATNSGPEKFHTRWLGFRVVCSGVLAKPSTVRRDGGPLVWEAPSSVTIDGVTFPKMGTHRRFVKDHSEVLRLKVKEGKLLEKKSFPLASVAPRRRRAFVNSFDMEFVWIKPGKFTMGSPRKKGPTKGYWQKVWLTKGIWLSKFELTQKKFSQVTGYNPSKNKGNDKPVNNVTWYELQQFCKALSLIEGVTYRLPTEAEWEYSARAGSLSPRKFHTYAWYEENANKKSHDVGRKRANRWGLHDMFGNVAEWCEDTPAVYVPGRRVQNPRGFVTSSHRAIRGGSYLTKASRMAIGRRQRDWPSRRLPNLGGRIALVID